ncbi:MAG TPA: hypothetical protein PKA90_02375 [Ignavibacteria bacterium]|nr:hypothetical protein [Ignavibacteria bacterium]HMR39254.1 hypothetical protein [Ignavibacteria bacterium]
MFIGHFGVGFGAKKYAPVISLGYLFIAAQFLDLIWPTLLLLNIEHVVISPGITKLTPLDFTDYPLSHSLLMVTVWGLILGIVSFLFLKKFRYSLVIFVCVISHWFLDLIVHRPDLPLLPAEDSMKTGFGLWNYPYLSVIIEGLIFFTGVFIYYKATKPVNRTGKYLLVFLISFLVLIQIANIFGPPPPSVNAIAWAGQLQWLFVIIAFIVDRNRISA